jgi:hypothetical protein
VVGVIGWVVSWMVGWMVVLVTNRFII